MILLLLVVASVQSADVVERTVELYSNGGSSPQERVQGIPRESIIPMNDTGMVAVYMSWYVSAFNKHLLKFSDYGARLDNSIAIDANCGNHAHMAYRNDTLWLVPNPTSPDSVLIYLIDMENMIVLDTGTLDSAGYDGILAAIEHTSGSNMVMVVREGIAQSINGTYATSSDNGLTWTWQGDYFAFDHDIRFDLDRWGDSVVNIVFERGGVDKPYLYFLWDGSSWSSPDTIDMEQGGGFERLYSTVVGREGTIHVAWSDTSNPSHVIHAWKGVDSTVWVIDTPHTATQQITATGGIWTAMTHSNYGEVTRLFYTTSNTEGNDNDQNLYCKKWDYDNFDWSDDSLEITTDTTCRNLSGCLNVPSCHGDRAYLHYICYDGTAWKNRLTVVVDSSTAPYLPVENKLIRLKGVK
jgi:hypothetical protein